MQEHEHFMARCISLAEIAASKGEVPVGCVVVGPGGVLAEAYNLRETLQDPCAHAEILAIRAAAERLGTWRLEGCTVYVTLEPCAMCAGAMILARVERCVFGCTDPKGGFLGTVDDLSRRPELNHQFAVESGVLGERCSAQLSDFFRALRARKRATRRRND